MEKKKKKKDKKELMTIECYQTIIKNDVNRIN